MKIFLISLSFLMGCNACFAQGPPKEKIRNDASGGRGDIDNNILTWGYYLGFNNYDYKFDYKMLDNDIQVEKSPSFNVGLIGDVKINDYINLRLEPGLYFGNRELIYDDARLTTQSEMSREVISTYIHVPLLVKFSTKRLNNWKPFVVGGVSTSWNLSSNEDNPNDNSANQFRQKTNTYYYEIGFGIDFYLFYFKFSPSIRGVFAINDELVRDADPNSPWTGNVESMKTRGIFINFTFQ